MKKISMDSAQALLVGKRFKRGNTEVRVLPNVSVLLLHGNEIAYRYNDPDQTLSVTNAGWFSKTTKERLNAIDGVGILIAVFICRVPNGPKWCAFFVDLRKLVLHHSVPVFGLRHNVLELTADLGRR